MKYYFIHIPKTGGVSIRNALVRALGTKKVLQDEMPLYQAELAPIRVVAAHVPHWVFLQADNCRNHCWTRFAVIRHPIDRLLSLYNYLSGSAHAKHVAFRGIGLDEFCDRLEQGLHPELSMCFFFTPSNRYADARDAILSHQIAIYPMHELDDLRKTLTGKLRRVIRISHYNRSRKVATQADLRHRDLSFLEDDARLYDAALRGEFPKLELSRLDLCWGMAPLWRAKCWNDCAPA